MDGEEEKPPEESAVYMSLGVWDGVRKKQAWENVDAWLGHMGAMRVTWSQPEVMCEELLRVLTRFGHWLCTRDGSKKNKK